jgi:hypothetical protein
VPENVSDFFPRFFGVIYGHVLAFLGASVRIAHDIFASAHSGVIGNDEGFLGAIGGLYGNGL